MKKNKNNRKYVEKLWNDFIEYIFLNYFHKNNTKIVIEGEDILSPIITKKKQVIFISGHFANFELMSMENCKKKIPLATICLLLIILFKSIYGIFKKKICLQKPN